jgi:hypothetical protein
MFERFTEAGRQVVVSAQGQARALGHGYVGTEHLLLGLLHDRDAIPARVLAARGVTAAIAREAIEGVVPRGTQAVELQQLPFTPRAKKVLELTLREALSLGGNHIGPEHILLGLLRESEGVAWTVLAELGALGGLRDQVLAAIGGEPRRGGGVGRPIIGRWQRAHLMWRPEGVELRIPIDLDTAEMAALAADPAWEEPPLAGLGREIWRGWLAIRSPTLLDDADPRELRAAIDAVLARIGDSTEGSRAEAFMRALREPPR